MALRTLCDRSKTRNEPLRRCGAPVAGDQRPHHDPLLQFAGGRNYPRVAKSEGRTEPAGRRARRRDDRIIAAAKLDGNLIWLQPEEIGMRVRMIADDMSAGGGLLEELRTFAAMLSDDEESRSRFVTIQKIEQLGRDRRVRPVVKGKRQLARRICAANRRAKKLRTRIDRTKGT